MMESAGGGQCVVDADAAMTRLTSTEAPSPVTAGHLRPTVRVWEAVPCLHCGEQLTVDCD